MKFTENQLPVFAIGMPVYNGASFIEKALLSCINIEYAGKFYIIVSDDCSTDGTWDIVNSFAAKYPDFNWVIEKHVPKSRLGGNQQNTIRMCPADVDIYVKLDADDTSCANRLTILAEYFMENPDVDIIGSNVHFITKDGYITMPDCTDMPILRDSTTTHKYVMQWGCTLAFTRKLWEAYPPMYDYVDTDDQVWSLRGRLFGKMMNIPDRLIYYRLHENQMSSASNIVKFNRWNTYKQFDNDTEYAHKHNYISFSQYLKTKMYVQRYAVAYFLNKFRLWRWLKDKRKKNEQK